MSKIRRKMPTKKEDIGNDGQRQLTHHYTKIRRLLQTASSWSRTGACDPNDPIASPSFGQSLLKNEVTEEETIRALISQLSEFFYQRGWQPGTGGGLSIRTGIGSKKSPFRVYTTPSGVQKEDMIGHDIFVLDMKMNVISPPRTHGLSISSMTSLWYIVYRHRPKARCVIHTHGINAVLASLLDETSNTLRLTHLEMIKGVDNHSYSDILEIPIIPNQLSEDKLGPEFERVIEQFPKSNVILVRRHGVYVWGNSWEHAKTQLESVDYLFECAVKMRSLDVCCSAMPPSPHYDVFIKKKRVISNQLNMYNEKKKRSKINY